jgi:hypothetical protein
MSIILQGSTSGSVTLQEPAVAGSTVLDLPATSGNVVVDSATQTLTNKTLTTPSINSAQFATVSGTAPIYPCRAWINLNGVGTVAIRSSGNVTSITDNGTGDYTITFTTAMPDANYSVAGAARYDGTANSIAIRYLGIVNSGSLGSDMSTSSVRVNIGYQNGLLEDPIVATVIIVR